MPFTSSAVSAPGKVFLAGGYLVLDKDYSALVFALSARIHVISASDAATPGNITVRSPQFQNAEWTYEVSTTRNRGISLSQHAGQSKNAFVQTTVCYALSYLAHTDPEFSSTAFPGTAFTILADNDYYSQPPSTKPLPRFNRLGVAISDAHKTGLGSSAALVTSLTACLLSSFSSKYLDLSVPHTQQTIHNLAQAAHCAAQGKVGSGFDIAAAVYGSCIYHRFSPSVLETVGEAGSEGFAERLAEVVNKAWDLKVEPTRVPPGLRLIMGDVDCGSSTPGMVKKVLSWRKQTPELAKKQWDTIEELNVGLRILLEEVRKRAQQEPEEYKAALQQVQKSSRSDKTESYILLQNIAERIKHIRQGIRTMGEAAGVPIEPPAQTKVLNSATDAINGVLGGVVPGAGGYDAVVFLMLDTDETLKGLKMFLDEWQFEGEHGSSGKVKTLDTREEHEGVRSENLGDYKL